MTFACLFSLLLLTAGAKDSPQPQDATQAIIQAFDSHSIVMFGEANANKQESPFPSRFATVRRQSKRHCRGVREFPVPKERGSLHRR